MLDFAEKSVATTTILISGKTPKYKRTFIVVDESKEIYAYAGLFDYETLLCVTIDGAGTIARKDKIYIPLSAVLYVLEDSKNERRRTSIENVKLLQRKILETYESGE